MSTCSEVREAKGKKLKGKSDNYKSHRSLDDIHETILNHILSFLPLELAVRTSVLSKRWEFMWTLLPSLVFKEHKNGERRQFMDFVGRVLIFHDFPRIRKFSLTCNVGNDASRIRTWISAAVRHNAREFLFDFDNECQDMPLSDSHMFPHCLFSSEKIEVLKIQTMGFLVPLPAQIYLPRLKTLTFKDVIFKDYHPANLLFGSPALEELVIEDCEWEMNINEITISAPKLWRLTIREGNVDYDSMGELASNSMTISAPKLKMFKYWGGLYKEYRFTSPPSIFKASLLYVSGTMDRLGDHFDELLRSLRSVKYLQISSSFVEALSDPIMPTFEKLIFLEVYNGEVELCWEQLEMILNNCPHLEILRFAEGICSDSEAYDFDLLLDLELIYLPSTLKKFMLGSFSGSITELSGVQVLLEKLTSLETMEIEIDVRVAQRKEIEALVSAFPRGSKSCKLNFSSKQLWFEQIVSNLEKLNIA